MYYYELDLGQGFVFQCVYIDDCFIDEIMIVENENVVIVFVGYYLVGVLDGYIFYYLNVMVGFMWKWKFYNDLVYEWILEC